jgi:hypothetical protein
MMVQQTNAAENKVPTLQRVRRNAAPERPTHRHDKTSINAQLHPRMSVFWMQSERKVWQRIG